MTTEKLVKHLNALHKEVAELKTRIQPHDTGRLRTTISVLESRIEEISQQIIRN